MAFPQVKYARSKRSEQEEQLARLKKEVAVLTKIEHPNVVCGLGATQHKEHFDIFIEWMAGIVIYFER